MMEKKHTRHIRTAIVVVGLLFLPVLASFVQQRLLHQKIQKLGTAQAAPLAPARSDHDAAQSGNSFNRLTFDVLKSWTYVEGKTPIPDFIQKLNGNNLEMIGFMMPLTEIKNITEFLLVPSLWGCCYGQPPSPNHMVVVRMPKGQTTKFFTDVIRVRGRFNVGETKQDGYVVSLYVLTADKIDEQ